MRTRIVRKHPRWLGTFYLATICGLPLTGFAQSGNCTGGQTSGTSGATSQASSGQTSSTSSTSQLSSLISSLQQQLQSGTLTAAQQQRATRLLAALERIQALGGTANATQVRLVNSLATTSTQPTSSNLAAAQAQRINSIARANPQANARVAGGGFQRQFQTVGGRPR